MKIFKLLSISFLLLSVISFWSCGDDDSSTRGTSSISVKLVDAPGDYDAVNVEVIDVLVKYEGESGDLDAIFEGEDYDDDGILEDGGEWISLNAINTGRVNLLDLVNGVELILVDDYEIPSGLLTDIRLILGEDNDIVMDGVEYDLKTPSGQQSGLKIKTDAVLEPNLGYTFILDFNVDESIVFAGSSENINLKPVMRAEIEAFTGAISGQIEPAGVDAEVSATSDGIEFITTNVDENGNFVLAGVLPGTYTITITPEMDSGLEVTELTDIEVTLGATTDLGVINIETTE